MKSTVPQSHLHAGIAKRSAFTLLEILIVISIAGVLAVLLLSFLGPARKSADLAKCTANLRRIGEAVLLYSAENNGIFPPSYSSPGEIGTNIGERDWYQYLQHASLAAYDNTGILPNPNFPGNTPKLPTIYNCPANPDRIGRWYTPNYAYNWALGLNERRVHSARVSSPGRTVMAVDAGIRSPSSLAAKDGPPNILCYATAYGGSSYYWQKSINFKVHGGRANFLMADGHVELLNSSDVETRAADKTLLWSRDNLSSTDAIW